MKGDDEEEASNASEYETPQKGAELGASTRPTPLGLSGLLAGGEGAITKKFSIDNEEGLVEMERDWVWR